MIITAILIASIIFCSLEVEQVQATQTNSRQVLSAIDATIDSPVSPAQIVSNDSNWAGYVTASDLQTPQPTITSVSAFWTVPTVDISSNDTFSAVWIGIGGFFDQTLIQCGSEQDSIQGQADYYIWIELLPGNSMTVDTINVSPGDQINASIQLVNSNGNIWSVTITDLTANQSFQRDFIYLSSQLSAEWILERPEISSFRSRGTISPLADIGQVNFTNCEATVGGIVGSIDSFPYVQSVMYETVQPTNNQGINQLTVVSELTDNGLSFAVETFFIVPELTALIVLPILAGIGLFVAIARKRPRKDTKKS